MPNPLFDIVYVRTDIREDVQTHKVIAEIGSVEQFILHECKTLEAAIRLRDWWTEQQRPFL